MIVLPLPTAVAAYVSRVQIAASDDLLRYMTTLLVPWVLS